MAPSFKYAVYGSSPEAAALTNDQESRLIAKAHGIAEDWSPSDNREYWTTIQFSLLMSLVNRSGDEQIAALKKLPPAMPLLIQFNDIIKAPSPEAAQAALEEAIDTGEANGIIRVLLFVALLGASATPQILNKCIQLSTHEYSVVRAYTFAALLKIGTPEAIADFWSSEWSTANLDKKGAYFERWYGGHLLIEAAVRGDLPHEELVARITPEHFGHAIDRIGAAVVSPIMHVMDTVIQHRLVDGHPSEPPLISRSLADSQSTNMVFVELEDRPVDEQTDTVRSSVDALMESDEAFQELQTNRSKAYQAFVEMLNEKGDDTLLGDIGYATIEACHEADPERVERWARVFLDANSWDQRALKNVGLHMARAIRVSAPETTRLMIAALAGVDGFVKLQSGRSKTSYEAIVNWASAKDEAAIELCFTRLDRCSTDLELADETQSALMANRGELLARFIEERSSSGHPMDLARALVVSGAANIRTDLIDTYFFAAGPVGAAARTALKAVNRLNWMVHWWEQMQIARDREAFWRASVLFRGCVDGRIDFLEPSFAPANAASSFLPTLEQDVSIRIKEAAKDLSNKLFGSPAPKRWFVVGDIA